MSRKKKSPAMDAETTAWWKTLVRPVFFAMHDKGIAALHIERQGTKVRFTLIPER